MLRGFAMINYWTDDFEAATRWYSEFGWADLHTSSSASVTPRTSSASSTVALRPRAR
jgi:hypothetical protein